MIDDVVTSKFKYFVREIPAYNDALSVLNGFADIHSVYGDVGIQPGVIDSFYSIIKVFKVIGISKALDLSVFVCPPLIFYSPKGPLCLSSMLGEPSVRNGRGWVVESSIMGSVLPLQQIVDI